MQEREKNQMRKSQRAFRKTQSVLNKITKEMRYLLNTKHLLLIFFSYYDRLNVCKIQSFCKLPKKKKYDVFQGNSTQEKIPTFPFYILQIALY